MLRSKSLYKYVREALLWSKENFYSEQHFNFLGLSDKESEFIRGLYTDLYTYDSSNYFDIIIENLNSFYYNFLNRRLITENEFESLKSLMYGRFRTVNSKNEFPFVDYIEINIEAPSGSHLSVIIRPEINNILINEQTDALGIMKIKMKLHF